MENPMRTNSKELLAVGIFGRHSRRSVSRLGDRIELLLRCNRTFSPLASTARIAASAAALLMLAAASSIAPRWLAFAQAPRPHFDVVSIKPTPENTEPGADFSAMVGGRLHVRNNGVSNLIGNAYGFRGPRLIGIPNWSEHFDMEARAEGNPTKEQIMLMLQSVLEERFKLQAHHEMRDMPGFNMVVAKSGLKVKAWQEGTCAASDPFKPPPEPIAGAPRLPHCGNNLTHATGPKMAWSGVKIDMDGVAGALTAALRRQVINQTGFKGNFDLELEWTTDPALGDAAGDDTGPSLFTLLEDKLGVKLEQTKIATEVLVVDHVEKPDAN
jgi:uncharacterized protein (TIGR03435 family)